MQLSKSDYMLFLRQPAWLWLKKNDPSKLPPIDAATQAMFDAGHAFEPYVESLFPEGVTLGFSDFDEYRSLPLRTHQAFESGAQVVFQPRFEWNEFTCISDIVSVVENKTIDLYEIKSSTRVKPDHLYDLAFQKTVIEGNGFTVRNIFVIHVNNQYVREGEVNPKELTTFADVTEDVNEIALKTPEYMEAAKNAAMQAEMPDPNPELARLGSKSEWMKVYENIFPPEPMVWPADTRAEINKQETEMLYHAIVLLMAYPKRQHLKMAIHCYLSPEFVKRRMEFLTIEDTYEYWRLEVPKFMKQQNDIANLLRHFYINVALVIGEDEVQDLCKNYGKEK